MAGKRLKQFISVLICTSIVSGTSAMNVFAETYSDTDAASEVIPVEEFNSEIGDVALSDPSDNVDDPAVSSGSDEQQLIENPVNIMSLDTDEPDESDTDSSCGQSAVLQAEAAGFSGLIASANSNGSGYDLIASGIYVEGGFTNVAFCIWSDANGTDDVIWVDAQKNDDSASYALSMASLKNFGLIHTEVWVGLPAGGALCIGAGNFTAEEPALISEVKAAADPQSGLYHLTVPGFSMDGCVGNVAFEVESPSGRTIWYDAYRQEDGTYVTEQNVSAFQGAAGTYKAGLYLKDCQGRLISFGRTEFTYDESAVVPYGKVSAALNDSSITVTTEDISVPGGLRNIAVCTYSDGSDVRWLDSATSGTTSVCNVSVYGYESVGTVILEVYAASVRGTIYLLGTSKVELQAPEVIITEEDTKEGFLITASNVSVPRGLRNVAYKVWSSDGGYDDETWLDAPNTGSTASATVPVSLFKHFGTVNCEVYAASVTGKVYMLGSVQMENAGPKGESLKITTDNEKAEYSAEAVFSNESAIHNVAVKITSPAGAEKWYDMADQGKGHYTITNDISDFAYMLGTYGFEIYERDTLGNVNMLLSDTAEFVYESPTITITPVTRNMEYKVTMAASVYPGGLKKISTEVSDLEGKGTCKWYDTQTDEGGNVYFILPIKDFGVAGKYSINFWGENQADVYNVLSTTTELTVSSNANYDITVTAEDNRTFTASAKLKTTDTPISNVKIAAWTKDNQSDKYVFETRLNEDGTYTAEIDPVYCGGNIGDFHLQTLVVFENNIEAAAGETVYSFNPENFLAILNTGIGTKYAKVVNIDPVIDNLAFEVYSEENGVDDDHWYQGIKIGEGMWDTTAISGRNILHSGTAIVTVWGQINGESAFKITEGTCDFDSNETLSALQAKDILNRIGWDLRNAFNYSAGLRYTKIAAAPAGQSHLEYYASFGYTNGYGHCYVMAATFCQMARALGYECYYVEGAVVTNVGYAVHGWTEIVINGQVYVFDPNFTNETGRNGYMITYGTSGTWRYVDYQRVG